jgi:hypothetical protein
MTTPVNSREEFDRTLTRMATYLAVAGSLALMMSFAYESAKSHFLDPTADVIGAFTLNDLMLALRHWLPMHLAWWLLGGVGAFLGARRKLSGLPLLAVVLGSCIGADLASRLLPAHFSQPLTWLDYVLLTIGLAAAVFLIGARGAALNATKLVVATALGLVCIAGVAGIEDASSITLKVLIRTIDPDTRACPTETLGQGGRLVLGDFKRNGRARYWYEPSNGKTPFCRDFD